MKNTFLIHGFKFFSFINIALILTFLLSGCSSDSNEIKVLTKPIANTPINNSILVDNLSQELKWANSSSVGLSEPINYQVFFGESENTMKLIASTRSTSLEKNDLEFDKTYYWRIIANSDGKSEPSEILNFKIRKTLDIEKEGLLAIFNSLGGGSWINKTNWNTADAISTWFGVEVDDNGHVMSIKLNNNNLKGTIPDEIANFKNLITLNLSQNEFNLQGTEFPIKITELSKLQNLYLNNCNLISNTTIINGFEEKFITKKIGNLSALKILDLSNNKLNGPLIFEWGNLKSLEELNISNNDLSGILSSELGNLRKIKKISAGGNLFTGSIPYEIGNIQSLEEFSFQENSLSGALPDFTKSNIKVFFVGGNQALSGNLSVSGLCKPNLTINIDGTNITDDCP